MEENQFLEEENNDGLKPSNSHATLLAASPLVGLLFTWSCLPWVVIFPLILWFIWKDNEPEVMLTGKKVLNGQISWFIFLLVVVLVFFVLSAVLPLIGTMIGTILGLIILLPVAIAWLVFTIINIVRVSKGNYEYQMPLSFTFFK